MTNPIWVVKVRMFTTSPNSPQSYRGLWGNLTSLIAICGQLNIRSSDGLSSIVKTEGVPGLFKGTSLALFGVTNGAIQFMAYEKMKQWGFERKRKQFEKSRRPWTPEVDKLASPSPFYPKHDVIFLQSNTAYTVMSGASKIVALTTTYPYQVIRSRLQVISLSYKFLSA